MLLFSVLLRVIATIGLFIPAMVPLLVRLWSLLVPRPRKTVFHRSCDAVEGRGTLGRTVLEWIVPVAVRERGCPHCPRPFPLPPITQATGTHSSHAFVATGVSSYPERVAGLYLYCAEEVYSESGMTDAASRASQSLGGSASTEARFTDH